MGKSPTRESVTHRRRKTDCTLPFGAGRRDQTNSRNSGIGTFTIATGNTSSPLRSIGQRRAFQHRLSDFRFAPNNGLEADMGFDMLQMATGFDARCFTPMPDPSSVVRSLAESGPTFSIGSIRRFPVMESQCRKEIKFSLSMTIQDCGRR
jgi:hypothetical protein